MYYDIFAHILCACLLLMEKNIKDSILARLTALIEQYWFLEKKIHRQYWEERYISYGYRKWSMKKLLLWIHINPKYTYITVVFDNYNNGVVDAYPTVLLLAEEKTRNIMKIKIHSLEDLEKKWVEELITLYSQTIWKAYWYIYHN